MADSLQRIPDRIQEDEYEFLNCRVGSDSKPESSSESIVLENLEVALSDSFLQIYYKYPDISRGNDNEYLDIVALHPDAGIVVLEVYDIDIGDVTKIQGPDWYIEESAKPIRPTSIPQNGKVAIRHEIEQREELVDDDYRSIVSCQSYAVMPGISTEEFEFMFPDEEHDAILFKDDIIDRERFSSLLKLDGAQDLTDKNLRDALGVLKFSNAISGEQLNTAATPDSKRELIERIDQRLKIITDKQLKIGLQSPETPQQIRGIAGSGKTVVTAFRAARLHWENEDWNIAVTFRNRGLRQTLRNLISDFYHQFSDGDDIDENKLDVFHAWGGGTPGMYSELADAADVPVLSYKQAERKYRYGDHLANVCGEVVKSGSIPEVYDAILIDEGQDLPSSFFKMCYAACTDEKRLYWSYDEAQSLGNLQAASTEELFGTDSTGSPLVDVSGTTEGGYNKTQVMRTSFRTPRTILMTAHGFGMGMYREGPVVQAITNQEGWDYIGYNTSEGNFRHPGNEVTLKRKIENSPHPLWEYQSPSELLDQEWADTREDEIKWVINDIKRLVEDEGVKPEEIMITYLWPYEIRDELLSKVINGLESALGTGVVNDVSHAVDDSGVRGKMKVEDKVSLTNIYHSRGNQAPIVYVMGLDMVAEETSKELAEGKEKKWREEHVKIRNKAFVGFTRTQGWLKVTGTDPTNRIVGELNRVLQDTMRKDPRLEMVVPPEDSPFKDLEPNEIRDEEQDRLSDFF